MGTQHLGEGWQLKTPGMLATMMGTLGTQDKDHEEKPSYSGKGWQWRTQTSQTTLMGTLVILEMNHNRDPQISQGRTTTGTKGIQKAMTIPGI